MFYLGFSNCASAEACLIVFFSIGFYAFLAKKEDFWKFTKIRPDYDESAKVGELTIVDKALKYESFYSVFANKAERGKIYMSWMFVPHSEIEMVIRIQASIDRDVTRIELRRFMDREVTERWSLLYKKYANPKDAWYS